MIVSVDWHLSFANIFTDWIMIAMMLDGAADVASLIVIPSYYTIIVCVAYAKCLQLQNCTLIASDLYDIGFRSTSCYNKQAVKGRWVFVRWSNSNSLCRQCINQHPSIECLHHTTHALQHKPLCRASIQSTLILATCFNAAEAMALSHFIQ